LNWVPRKRSGEGRHSDIRDMARETADFLLWQVHLSAGAVLNGWNYAVRRSLRSNRSGHYDLHDSTGVERKQ
jgi:hypothetical protein